MKTESGNTIIDRSSLAIAGPGMTGAHIDSNNDTNNGQDYGGTCHCYHVIACLQVSYRVSLGS